MFLLIQRRPLSGILGLDADAGSRLADGLLTINLGVQPPVPDAPETPQMVEGTRPWHEVMNDLGANYGNTLHALQRKLVERRATLTLPELQSKLGSHFDRFCKRANKRFSAENLPEHVVHRFALLYTAYRVAVWLQILPKVGDSATAIWRMFERYVAARPKPPTAAAILQEIAARPDVRRIAEIDATLDQAELEHVCAFIKERGDGARELWVLSGWKERVFNWPAFSALPDFGDRYLGKGEKDRLGAKRVIGAWKNARVLRFRLP